MYPTAVCSAFFPLLSVRIVTLFKAVFLPPFSITFFTAVCRDLNQSQGLCICLSITAVSMSPSTSTSLFERIACFSGPRLLKKNGNFKTLFTNLSVTEMSSSPKRVPSKIRGMSLCVHTINSPIHLELTARHSELRHFR